MSRRLGASGGWLGCRASRWKAGGWPGRSILALAVILNIALAGLSPTLASATDTIAPTEPGAITASSLTGTSIALKWGSSTDASGIEGYRVYRGPTAAADTALSLIATTDAVTSFSATQLYSGTGYKFGVVAIDTSNNKSLMRTTTIMTSTSSDTTAPAAPSSASVTFRVFSDSRIDVGWGASSSTDVVGYHVIRDGSLVATVDLPGTPRYSDNGLLPGTSHSYSIEAVDSAGNLSTGSPAKTIKTLAAGTVILARGPYLSNVTGTSGVVSWWTNVPTTGTVTIAGGSVNDPAGPTQHHVVTVSGLSPGTSYPYTVASASVTGGGTLRTAAAPGQTFSFAAISDFGGGSGGETQNANNINGAGTQFIQTMGDNVYPSSGLPDPNFTTTYSDFDQRFFKPFGAAVKSQAFFPTNGNKEYYGDGEFWAAFPMLGSNHSWYSYDWGDAHLLCLDSEQSFAPTSDQYLFAQADLAAHQSAAWRIVAIQRPPTARQRPTRAPNRSGPTSSRSSSRRRWTWSYPGTATTTNARSHWSTVLRRPVGSLTSCPAPAVTASTPSPAPPRPTAPFASRAITGTPR